MTINETRKRQYLNILTFISIGFMFISLAFDLYKASFWGFTTKANGFQILSGYAEGVKSIGVWLQITSIAIIIASVVLAILFFLKVRKYADTDKLRYIVIGICILFAIIYLINANMACDKFADDMITAKNSGFVPLILQALVVVGVFAVKFLSKQNVQNNDSQNINK